MLRVTDLARLIVQHRLQPGMTAIDATVGNGHDTVMLADAVGPGGHVYGFDIQTDALAHARVRLGARAHVSLIEAGHETMAEHIPSHAHGQIGAIMFNLGYLPGAEKTVTTQPETTLTAVSASVSLLATNGVITVALYPGHAEGLDEAEAVRAFVTALPATFGTLHTSRLNPGRLNSATSAPQLIVIERLR